MPVTTSVVTRFFVMTAPPESATLMAQSSVTARLQELLCKEELGDEKPSDLLRRMKKLLDDKYDSFDKESFHHLYFQCLPTATQQSLCSIKGKLLVGEIVQLADDFMATLPPSTLVTAVMEKPTSRLQS
ncbi:hypothetical protein E2C01_043238 [Portunus trituberculatus]|uniref:Uncharacterized protein n=1 Tax=Portunus trituberculatus TaxID=210409 RepID=A0A5B7FVS4_PORTR|nr:hypothetical protein [Portunus trituberculatus]